MEKSSKKQWDGVCFEKTVSEMAIKALVYEVSTSPKPGLVDRYNTGAHKDMDFFMFLQSAYAIGTYFEEVIKVGMAFDGDDLTQLFRKIRPIGLKAEEKMFQTTKGVNTHKGIIFSMFTLCGAIGYLSHQQLMANPTMAFNFCAEEICETAAKLIEGITKNELEILCHQKFDQGLDLSHGEKLYLNYNVRGIRGEAESGYPSVIQYGLPIIRNMNQEKDQEHSFVQTLFSLMAHVEDTNILHRQDMETLQSVQEKSQGFLNNGGVYQANGIELVKIMDQFFIQKNISPGGSADLLAITIFLGLIEGVID